MKENKRNIQSMFSGFEPEVDNSAIDTGWEKIKYFLPAEKKKRPLLFFRKRGVVLFLMAVFIFSLCFVTVKHFKIETKDSGSGTGVIGQKKEIVFTPTIKETIKPRGNGQPKNPGSKTDRTSTAPDIKYERNGLNTSGKVYSSIAVIGKKDFAKTNDLGEASSTNNTEPENNMEPRALILADNGAEEYLELNTSTPLYLPGVPGDSIEPLLAAIPRASLFNGAGSRKFSIELFVGPDQTITKTHIPEPGLNKVSRQLNFSAGCGLVYKHNEAWEIIGDLKVSRNKFNYSYGGMTGNKIISKSAIVTTVTTAFVPDTMVTYTQIHSDNLLYSNLSYNFSLGAAYTLYKKRRLMLSAFAQLSLRRSVYTFSRGNYKTGDTLSYVLSTSSKPLDNVIESEEPSQKTRYTATGLGLVPGLILSYNVTSKVTWMLRPAYFTQISAGRIKPVQSYFSLKQSNVFIDLGISIKL